MFSRDELASIYWSRYHNQFESYKAFTDYLDKNPKVLDEFYSQLEIEWSGERLGRY